MLRVPNPALIASAVPEEKGASRVYLHTRNGGPGDGLQWFAGTASAAKAQVEDIAEDTNMVLPTNQGEREQLFEDVEDWIDSEWMTPDAYYTLHGW